MLCDAVTRCNTVYQIISIWYLCTKFKWFSHFSAFLGQFSHLSGANFLFFRREEDQRHWMFLKLEVFSTHSKSMQIIVLKRHSNSFIPPAIFYSRIDQILIPFNILHSVLFNSVEWWFFKRMSSFFSSHQVDVLIKGENHARNWTNETELKKVTFVTFIN